MAKGSHAHGDGAHAGHSHGVSPDADTRKLAFTLALIVGFMCFEIVVGLVVGSLALLSDSAHMLTDAAAIGLSIVAIRLAARPAQGRHDVRLPARRDPLGAGERRHAAGARRC